MTSDNFIMSLLALLAEREERSNGVNGMLGVMFVVRNRVNAGWNGGDWVKVITSHNQFSSISVLGDSQTVWYPDSREPNFQRILQEVDGVYDGSTADTLTNNALYYADLSSPGYNKGGWFDRCVANSPDHPRVAVIGSTTYFK